MIGVYILFYIVCVVIFTILFWYVVNNEERYNKIPEKYNRSVWYIGDSKTSYSKRSKHYIRESVFLLVSIVIWLVLLMIVFFALHIFRIRGIGSYMELSSTGLYISATISLFLSVFYSNIILLSNNPFCVSICMYRAKDSRGNFLKREMLVCLVATILLMPFALLGTDHLMVIE